MRGRCNNPVTCEKCGSRDGLPKRRLCRPCQASQQNDSRAFVWTDGQIQMLRDAYAGSRYELVAKRKRIIELTGCGRGALDAQIQRLGLRTFIHRPYTPEDLEYIRENAGEAPVKSIAKHLKRAPRAVKTKIYKLGLRTAFRAEGFNQKEFADCMGVTEVVVRKWIDHGALRLFDSRITYTGARQFLSQQTHLYNVRRVDDDWFKDLIFGETRHAS